MRPISAVAKDHKYTHIKYSDIFSMLATLIVEIHDYMYDYFILQGNFIVPAGGSMESMRPWGFVDTCGLLFFRL